MISATQVKNADKTTTLEFRSPNAAPDHAILSWFRDEQVDAVGEDGQTKQETITVEDTFYVGVDHLHDDVYTLNHFVRADEFWVLLDTETVKVHFENLYNFGSGADKELHYSTSSTIDLLLPYCDYSKINVSLKTVDGKGLTVWNMVENGQRFWTAENGGVYYGYGQPKFVLNIMLSTDTVVREGDGGSWEPLYEMSSFYVQIENVQNIITQPLIQALYTDEEDYGVSWGTTVYL